MLEVGAKNQPNRLKKESYSSIIPILVRESIMYLFVDSFYVLI